MIPALIIDTSLYGVALAAAHLSHDNCEWLAQYVCAERQAAERELAPQVASILHQFSPQQIIVSIGPGSFTGIRIGLALAMGMVATPASLRGISSLQAIARLIFHNRQGQGNLFLPLTSSYGIRAEIGPEAELTAFTLDDMPTLKTKEINLMVGCWPQLEDITGEKMESIKSQELALAGLAWQAQQELDRHPPDTWPQPLYLRKPYGQEG